MTISLDEWGVICAPFSVKYKIDPFYIIFDEECIKVSTRILCRKENMHSIYLPFKHLDYKVSIEFNG